MKLSVCIPTHDRASLDELLQSLQSAVEAYHGDLEIEICVSDNHSKPETAAIAERWASRFPLFTYSRSESFLELSESVIRSTTLASGDYLTVIADDDLVQVNYFDYIGRVLSEHPDVVYVEKDFIDQFGAVMEQERYEDNHFSTRLELLEQVGANLNFISSVIVRTSLYSENRGDKWIKNVDPRNYFKYLALWMSALPVDAKSVYVRTPLIQLALGQQKSNFGKAFFEYFPKIVKVLKKYGYTDRERQAMLSTNLDAHLSTPAFNSLGIPLFRTYFLGLGSYGFSRRFHHGMLKVYLSRTDWKEGVIFPRKPQAFGILVPIEAGEWDFIELREKQSTIVSDQLYADGWLGSDGRLMLSLNGADGLVLEGELPPFHGVDEVSVFIHVDGSDREERIATGDFAIEVNFQDYEPKKVRKIHFRSEPVFRISQEDDRETSVLFKRIIVRG